MNFYEQIKSPKWQKRRLEIMELHNFTCEECGSNDKELNIHHVRYVKDRDYWDYSDGELRCLCFDCHQFHHDADHHIKDQLSKLNKMEKVEVSIFIKFIKYHMAKK